MLYNSANFGSLPQYIEISIFHPQCLDFTLTEF